MDNTNNNNRNNNKKLNNILLKTIMISVVTNNFNIFKRVKSADKTNLQASNQKPYVIISGLQQLRSTSKEIIID